MRVWVGGGEGEWQPNMQASSNNVCARSESSGSSSHPLRCLTTRTHTTVNTNMQLRPNTHPPVLLAPRRTEPALLQTPEAAGE